MTVDNLFSLMVLIAITLVLSGVIAIFILSTDDNQPPAYYEGYKAGFSFAMNMTDKCCQEFSDTCLNDPEMRGIFEGVMDDR